MKENKRLLIVDDSAAVQETLLNFLEDNGFDIESASNGLEALLKTSNAPDLIILDIMMPGMDGLELCRRLRANESTIETPIIMLTVLDDIKIKTEAIKAGANDFLVKPITREILRQRVNELLADKPGG